MEPSIENIPANRNLYIDLIKKLESTGIKESDVEIFKKALFENKLTLSDQEWKDLKVHIKKYGKNCIGEEAQKIQKNLKALFHTKFNQKAEFRLIEISTPNPKIPQHIVEEEPQKAERAKKPEEKADSEMLNIFIVKGNLRTFLAKRTEDPSLRHLTREQVEEEINESSRTLRLMRSFKDNDVLIQNCKNQLQAISDSNPQNPEIISIREKLRGHLQKMQLIGTFSRLKFYIGKNNEGQDDRPMLCEKTKTGFVHTEITLQNFDDIVKRYPLKEIDEDRYDELKVTLAMAKEGEPYPAEFISKDVMVPLQDTKQEPVSLAPFSYEEFLSKLNNDKVDAKEYISFENALKNEGLRLTPVQWQEILSSTENLRKFSFFKEDIKKLHTEFGSASEDST
jgi:hypothetical protein